MSTHKHMYKIKKLIRDYHGLEKGVLIEQHTELMKVANNPTTYISRRALKHFVERRRIELCKLHDDKEAVLILQDMISHVVHVITNPDTMEFFEIEKKKVYQKIYDPDRNLSIRVAADIVGSHLEIKSIHFVKDKSTTD